jgi:glutathione synthase/RimK-type ligase-like ATP-grasp enzyme
MILLWGSPQDTPLRQVMTALHRCRRPHVLVDQDATVATVASVSRDGPSGVVMLNGEEFDLRTVTAAYLRPQSRTVSTVDRLLGAWADATTDPIIVNRPAAMSANACKPFQLRWIAQHGFATPATLITTNAKAARDFKSIHGEVIYKSISGVRSIVSRLRDAHVLEDLQYCPTQFQEYIPGVDYRAHVVGEELFTCRVESDAVDYRYAQDIPVRLARAELPEEVAGRVLMMVRDMGLLLAGVDLRFSPTGRWYCFEVNPSPGFTFFADATNQPIADAVAQLLVRSARDS